MTQPPATLTPEQYNAALSAIERDFRKQINGIHTHFKTRMRKEAWGKPDVAARIQQEWDTEVDAALNASKQRIAELPRTPRKEAG